MKLKTIEHPEHYTKGKIEVIDFIIDQKFDYLEGNVCKYLCRYKFKGQPVEDLLKLEKYVKWLIERETAREHEKIQSHS